MEQYQVSKQVQVGDVTVGGEKPLVLIAGPCVIEDGDMTVKVALLVARTAKEFGIPAIFKTSFDKANRTSLAAARGIGMAEGLPILAEVRESCGCPVLTDVHEPEQCAPAAEAVDVLQIPAFLCRQTDLLVAAARTGRAINVKKGQFLAPWDMKSVVRKIRDSGNDKVIVCERGASFGYNTLVSDLRALPIMAAETGCPVVFDATHSVQQPGGKGSASGGQREFVPVLARAAVSVGVAAVFLETHQDPDNAPSDGPCMMRLGELPALVETLMAFDRLAKAKPVG